MEPTKNEECIELKNIKYKTMLLNGNVINETKTDTDDILNLNIFLENEKNNNITEPWSKLDKTLKLRKILIFAEKYKLDNMLNDEEKNTMIKFLRECLDKKKLCRVKDVTYNKETGEIIDIPSLSYNKNIKHFTLKNIDKRTSTSKSFPKSLILVSSSIICLSLFVNSTSLLLSFLTQRLFALNSSIKVFFIFLILSLI